MRSGSNKEKIFDTLKELCCQQNEQDNVPGFSTDYLASALQMKRPNISSILNELIDEDRIKKIKGKPVLYYVESNNPSFVEPQHTAFDVLVGCDSSLIGSIQKAKAAILYPPFGLHSLLLGPTGVGKTMFAELMYQFALDNKAFSTNAPFVSFNCADYANNPQLLFSHLFGSKKGSYTGLTEDRIGLVEKARNGILFMDEVHRLPPEGQEMLFNLLDKKAYRPLGGTEEITGVNVLIICATTENVDSVLLSTFRRRIPILIELPPLKERSLDERLELVCDFLKIEANRVGKEILISTDSLKNFLLYNCIGNIGQLKSDIQLSCANAFLRSISQNMPLIQIDISDTPDYVRKGIFNYKANSTKVDELLANSNALSFTSNKFENLIEIGKTSLPDDFYENIENRIIELRNRSICENDINLIMGIDIDNYFKKYIYRVASDFSKIELSKIVNGQIVSLVEDFLDYSSKKMNRLFTQRIYFSMCLHINSAIERINSGKPIINPKLNEIIEHYPDEYALSMFFSEQVEKSLGTKLPVDEIGFISMFLSDSYAGNSSLINNPVVLIAMHGVSTASSMADVVNKLVGADNTYAYDMPLDKPTKNAYDELSSVVCEIDRGGGVILLADMGSISVLGDVISDSTKIKIRTIDMATTLLGIECSRKAMIESNIDNIVFEVVNKNDPSIDFTTHGFRLYEPQKDNLILTVCITGEGSAVKLKNLIEDNIDIKNLNLEILPMSIMNKKEMHARIKKISMSKNILGIVGTINPEFYGIPFISASDMILDRNYTKIRSIVDYAESTATPRRNEDPTVSLSEIIDSIESDISHFSAIKIKSILLNSFTQLNVKLSNRLSSESAIGLLLHVCYAIDKILAGKKLPKFKYTQQILNKYKNEVTIIDGCFSELQETLHVSFSKDELCAIFYFLEGYVIDEL